MPLSEEELRLLEQMERALAAEDPKFVSTLQGRALERSAKLRAVLAGAVFIGGVALLLGGAMAQQVWLSIVAFVVMVGSATIGLTAWRGRHAPAQHPGNDQFFDPTEEGPSLRVVEGGRTGRGRKRGARGATNGSGFMRRIEQRWHRRRDQGF